MLPRTAIVALFLTGLAACGGGGGGSPTNPTPVTPTPTVVSLSISPATDLVTIQGTVTLSATATMSDGTTKTASGTWASDAAPVATVDGTGKVTGVAPGQATVTVTYENVKATRAIRVVPDYQGAWTGEYRILTCEDTGDFRADEWCEGSLEKGTIRVSLTLTQARDTVTGSWTHDIMSGTTQGTVETSGTLVMNGNGLYDKVPMTIAGWRSLSTDNRTQTGKFTLTFSSSVWKGTAVATVEVRTCTKG